MLPITQWNQKNVLSFSRYQKTKWSWDDSETVLAEFYIQMSIQ